MNDSGRFFRVPLASQGRILVPTAGRYSFQSKKQKNKKKRNYSVHIYAAGSLVDLSMQKNPVIVIVSPKNKAKKHTKLSLETRHKVIILVYTPHDSGK